MEHLAKHKILKPYRENTFTGKNSPTFFSSRIIQPKLTINQPNDIYEQEADAIADKVMRMPAPETTNSFFAPKPITSIQRKCSQCAEEEKLQRKENDEEEKNELIRKETGGNISPSITSNVEQTLNSNGEPINRSALSFMESRFGYDFSNVRIHNDWLAHRSSADINALAYTHGQHIFFGSGQYQPNTNSGKQLLAHELTHVVQQGHAQTTSIQRQDDDIVAESERMRDQFRDARRRDLSHIIDCNSFHKIRRDCPASTGVHLADVLARMRTRVAGNRACIRFFHERFHINPDIMFDPSRRPSITFVPLLGTSGRTRCPEPTCDSPIPSVSIGTATPKDNICNSPLLERVIMHELTHYAHCYRRWGDTGDEATSEEGATICMGTVQEALEAARRRRTTVQPKLSVNQPNDVYEQEADAVADKVMRMPAPDTSTPFFAPKPITTVQRKCSACEEVVNIQRQEKKDSKNDFPKLTLTTTFLPSPKEPDFLALKRPFFDRGVAHLWDPEAALSVWHYNFNFFHRIGFSPDFSATLSDITAPRFIDSQLKADNPSWWEITDQQLKTTTLSGSIPVLEFDPNFSLKAPSWIKKIFKKDKSIQRKCIKCEEEEKLDRKEKLQNIGTKESLSFYVDSLSSKGYPLPEFSKRFFEPRLGYNLSQVKIHTDTSAAESAKNINAAAYTYKNHIVFASGQYQPNTHYGKKLLAHELTHVVQQKKILGPQIIQQQHDPQRHKTPQDITAVERAKAMLAKLEPILQQAEDRHFLIEADRLRVLTNRKRLDENAADPAIRQKVAIEEHNLANLNRRPLRIKQNADEIIFYVQFQVLFQDPAMKKQSTDLKTNVLKGIDIVWKQTLTGDVFGGRKFTIIPSFVLIDKLSERDHNYWLIIIRITNLGKVAYPNCSLPEPGSSVPTSVTEPMCDGGVMSIPPLHIGKPGVLGHELLHLFGLIDRYFTLTSISKGKKPILETEPVRETGGRKDPLGAEDGTILKEDLGFLFDKLGVYKQESSYPDSIIASTRPLVMKLRRIVELGYDPDSLLPVRKDFNDKIIKSGEDL